MTYKRRAMPVTFRVRSFHGRAVLALLLSSLVGCFKLDDDDCTMFGRCGDSLAAEAYRLSPKCSACLKRGKCKAASETCERDPTCGPTVRCMLKLNPLDYQKCLVGLLEAGISHADDPNGAWEGRTDGLTTCLSDCQKDCERDRGDWRCVGRWDPGSPRVGFTARIAVILYRGPQSGTTSGPMPVADARVMQCKGFLPCDSDAGVLTDEEGVAALEISNDITTEGLYFAVTDENSAPNVDFPNTYYYPGRISSDGEQPIAIYVVSTEAVRVSRAALFGESDVPKADPKSHLLMEGGQALILPDACHEHGKTSTPDLVVQARVAGEPVPRCRHDSGADPVIPCIWYGDQSFGLPKVDLDLDRTQGWGGSIVGLSDGEHDVRVCDLDGGVVGYREQLHMATGWLTIARTWPLSSDEVAKAGKCDPLQLEARDL